MGSTAPGVPARPVGEGSDADEQRIDAAVALARELVDVAAAEDARAGRRVRARRRRLAALITSPALAEFTVELTDQVVRIADPGRAARRFARLVHDSDLRAMSSLDRALLRIGARAAARAPRVVMPLVVRRLRRESAEVILPANDPALGQHLDRRRREGIRSNVNVLGEAIVGDDEADRRLEMVLARLRRDDVDYVSVKISAICAGISTLAFDDTVERVVERLRVLFQLAASFDPPKFVNLDMEEYRDLDLTVAAFQRLLDEPEFERLPAGIVLQAYLPEVREVAERLASWATTRYERTRGTIRVRLVKGANLAMETVEAELHGWPVASFDAKADVDANYKAVLDVLLHSRFDRSVQVGVASHNLFEVAWALVLRSEMMADGRPDRVEIEMLEGMASSQADAVRQAAGSVLLYAPIVARDDFAAAIAYLVRRLDENTSPDNFLAHVFDIADDPRLFDAEAEKFRTAVRSRRLVPGTTRRTQRRGAAPAIDRADIRFTNASDTDWTRAGNRGWIARWLGRRLTARPCAPVSVEAVDACVARSVAAQDAWASVSHGERSGYLERVADLFERDRGRILATMVDDAGKTVGEGDPEVSEGVDFARYYASSGRLLAEMCGARARPLGPVVVAPPWNFPFAIPAGGTLAALAAGNTVILKPAPETVATAAVIAELCWEAGVPHEALQFVPAADDAAGSRLITHPDVAAVVLTGAADTARMFLDWRRDLRLHAETSGKNAIVVTASADLDQAVEDLVRSAFGHAGQKCSAASLAIVEAPLYDDPVFLERLRDAAATLRVGSASDLATDVGPLIAPPGPTLERGLTVLDPGETWLIRPECRSDDRRSWSPGIRHGVEPGSWFASTECFGPVLGLIRADDLEHAIAIQNSSEFGLTAGIQSLDPHEIATWTDRVEAGNLYVNRGITGAIVQRQPFGGWKRSVVGPTAKAGGPNYVATLCDWNDDSADSVDEVGSAFEAWMLDVGRVEHDPTGLVAERNIFRYRPLLGGVLVRFGPETTDRERALARSAARAASCAVVESNDGDETVDDLAARVATAGVDRVRLVGQPDPGDRLLSACHSAGLPVDTAAPVSCAAVELPRWLREQVVTVSVHRHGRVPTGARRRILSRG